MTHDPLPEWPESVTSKHDGLPPRLAAPPPSPPPASGNTEEDAARRRGEATLGRLSDGMLHLRAADVQRRRVILHSADRNTRTDLARDLQALLNRYERESGSDTPDFLLANYMLRALEAAEELILAREGWYGAVLAPGVRAVRVEDECPG